MRALVLDRGDDAGLAVVEAHGLDARHVAQLRAHAVAGDQQARQPFRAVGEADGRLVLARREAFRRGRPAHGDAEAFGLAQQAAGHRAVRHHMGEGLAVVGRAGALEGEEDGAHRIGRARIGDDHAADRLGLGGDLVPHAEDIEEVARGRDDGRGALVLPPDMLRRAVHHLDGKVRRGLLDGDRQRQADIAAAGDKDVEHRGIGHGNLLAA